MFWCVPSPGPHAALWRAQKRGARAAAGQCLAPEEPPRPVEASRRLVPKRQTSAFSKALQMCACTQEKGNTTAPNRAHTGHEFREAGGGNCRSHPSLQRPAVGDTPRPP